MAIERLKERQGVSVGEGQRRNPWGHARRINAGNARLGRVSRSCLKLVSMTFTNNGSRLTYRIANVDAEVCNRTSLDRGRVAGRTSWVGKMAILDSGVAIITRVAVDNATDHAKSLGVLDLETTKLRTILCKGNLALKGNTEVLQSLVIGLVTTSVIKVSQKDTETNPARR